MPQDRLIKLQCVKCKRFNYWTNKSGSVKGGTEEKKLALKKFCKWCRGHTLHNEKKKSARS